MKILFYRRKFKKTHSLSCLSHFLPHFGDHVHEKTLRQIANKIILIRVEIKKYERCDFLSFIEIHICNFVLRKIISRLKKRQIFVLIFFYFTENWTLFSLLSVVNDIFANKDFCKTEDLKIPGG